MFEFLKLHVIKFVAAGALVAGLFLGNVVTDFTYKGRMKELNQLRIEKSFYNQIKENQLEYITNLTDLLKSSEENNKKILEGKINEVKTNIIKSDFSQCLISDELLDSLDAVGKS